MERPIIPTVIPPRQCPICKIQVEHEARECPQCRYLLPRESGKGNRVGLLPIVGLLLLATAVVRLRPTLFGLILAALILLGGSVWLVSRKY